MLNGFSKIIDAFKRLNYILTRKQKLQCLGIFILACIASVLDLMGVTIVLPILSALLSINEFKNNSIVAPILSFLNITKNSDIIFLLCTITALIYIVKNIFTVFYSWISSKVAFKMRRDISMDVFNAYIAQGYPYFVNHNSARILQGIGGDSQSVQIIIYSLFSLIIKIITVISIIVFIVIESPFMAFTLTALVAITFTATELAFKNMMKENGVLVREQSQIARQASLEAIQGSKEIFAMHRQFYFTNRYLYSMTSYDNACLKQTLGSVAPPSILEAVCVGGILFSVALQANLTADITSLITELAAIAIAAFRILPYVGAIISGINGIIFSAPGLNAAYDTLYEVRELKKHEYSDHSDPKYADITFSNELSVNNLCFSYNEDIKVLNNLNLTIKKGESIGLVGSSGAGKTTLADLLLGLYRPYSGNITMDGIDIDSIGSRWHSITGYIPQSVYLTDASIRRNVAFGVEENEIDDEKVWNALEMAQLKPFIETLEKGLDTKVGEWGVKFSGGQRQRIAIARALYSNPDILIMDEATAALDNDTEKAVMEAIELLQGVKTLIIVAHRLTTVRKCDHIYEISDGKAILKNYDEII